jgi:adenosylhomocysteine nucleosidase
MSTIAVMVAMDAELVHLRNLSPSVAERSVGIWDAFDLRIGSHEVVAVRSGIGMLNAAAATERVVAEIAPEVIFNYGCAGAQTVNHAALNIMPDGTEVHYGRGNLNSGERIYPAVIDADADLVKRARQVANSVDFEPWPVDAIWPKSVPHRNPIVHIGPMASSEIWTQQLTRLDLLHARHGSLSEDNESGAFAHVAYLHDIPFLAIRDIANNEYHKSSDLAAFSDFPVAEVGKRAAALVAALVEAL